MTNYIWGISKKKEHASKNCVDYVTKQQGEFEMKIRKPS